jgi:CTP-dependent riboflavin kinase
MIMDWNEFLIDLVNVLIPLLYAVITFGVGVAIKALKDKVKSDKAAEYIDMLTVAVNDTIGEMEQTMVKQFKKGAEDKKLTKEEGKLIIKMAIDKAREVLPEHVEVFLYTFYKDLNSVIRSKIESGVKQGTYY